MHEVPEWLALLRVGLIVLTFFVTLTYATVTTKETRSLHAKILEKFIADLSDLRITNRTLLRQAAGFLAAFFSRVYGNGLRVVAVSSGLTLLYIALVAFLNLSWILGLGNYDQAKQELDRSVDLSGMYTKDQIDRAMTQEPVLIEVGDRPRVTYVYSYNDDISKAIRDERDTRTARWFDALWKHPNREEIGALTLLKGYDWDPGLQWVSIVGLFCFNILFDLLVLVSIRYTLGVFASAQDFLTSVLASVSIVAITTTAYVSFLVPSVYFISGFATSYWFILLGLPIAFLISVACLSMLIILPYRVMRGTLNLSGVSILDTLVIIFGAIWVAAFIVIVDSSVINKLITLGPPMFTGKNIIPYALASCAAVPGLLTIVVLFLTIVARLTGNLTTTSVEWYLRSVLLAPEAVGIGLLVLPSLLVEGVYELWELLIKYHHDYILHWLG